MIRSASFQDFDDIYQVINDSAIAYKGVIPADRWQEPYMPKEELAAQIADGVSFSCFVDEEGRILGVMGIQDKEDVQLIRHAYVRANQRTKGIGTALLKKLIAESPKPILIGTWKAADWAIAFYQKHGFSLASESEVPVLLRKYWSVPERQIETSVVLADQKFRSLQAKKAIVAPIKLHNSVLRPWVESDAESMAKHANSREIWLHLRDFFPHPYALSDAESWLRRVSPVSPPTALAIEVGGHACGGISAAIQNDVHRLTAEIGYWLGEAHWDRGIMSEVVPAFTEYLFETFGLVRVFAVPYANNPASFRILERSGFLFEGRMQKSVIKDGEILDQLMYARVR